MKWEAVLGIKDSRKKKSGKIKVYIYDPNEDSYNCILTTSLMERARKEWDLLAGEHKECLSDIRVKKKKGGMSMGIINSHHPSD